MLMVDPGGGQMKPVRMKITLHQIDSLDLHLILQIQGVLEEADFQGDEACMSYFVEVSPVRPRHRNQ